LDFSNKKLQIIAVGSSIKLEVYKIPFRIIMKNISKKKPVKQRVSKREN
jgi:hypothetical protein